MKANSIQKTTKSGLFGCQRVKTALSELFHPLSESPYDMLANAAHSVRERRLFRFCSE